MNIAFFSKINTPLIWPESKKHMRLTAFLVLLHFVQGSSLLDPFYILSPKGVEPPHFDAGIDYGKYVSKMIGVPVGTLKSCLSSVPERASVMDLELYTSPIEKRQASTITGCTLSGTEADEANRKLSQTNTFEFNTFFEKKNDPNPAPPRPKQKSEDKAFPIWAIILICVGAVGICSMFIYCVCRSKNHEEEDDVECTDQRATRGSTHTMPSMNLRINVDENDLGSEMFNSMQFNLAIQNMNDIEGMMNDFGDQVNENIEIIDGAEKILNTAGEARKAEKMIEKFGETLDEEEKSLEDVEKIMEEGTERVEEALSLIDGLESVDKTKIVTIEHVENVENDAATAESVEKIADEKPLRKISLSTMSLSFGEEELENMLNMNKAKDFESFMSSGKSNQSRGNNLIKEAEDKSIQGTISTLLSDELKEINAMMDEEPLDFDSFKLTVSKSPFENSTEKEAAEKGAVDKEEADSTGYGKPTEE